MRRILLIFLVFNGSSVIAQGPMNDWAWQIGSGNNDKIYAIEYMDNNEMIIGGASGGVMDMDPINNSSLNTQSNGEGNQYYIAKYGVDGTLQWVTHDTNASGGQSNIRDLAVSDAYIYALGNFGGGGDFDVYFDETSFNSNGQSDLFITQFGLDGSFIGGTTIGGFGNEIAGEVEVDSNGNIWICGVVGHSSSGSATIEVVPNYLVDNPPNGFQTVFAAKLNQNLGGIWVGSFGNIIDDGSLELDCYLDVDGEDNVVIGGNFVDLIALNPAQPANEIAGAGRTMFISKLDSEGNYLWGHVFGDTDQSETNTGNDFMNDLEVDLNDNIIITGRVAHVIDFNPDPNTENQVVSAASHDVFVAKYDGEGNYVFAKSFICSGRSEGHGVGTDHFGNIYLSGKFENILSYDGVAVQSAGGFDSFWLCMGASGSLSWLESFGSGQNDIAFAIAVSGENESASIVAGGQVQMDIVPSPFQSLPEYDNSWQGEEDIYLISQSAEIHVDPCASSCQGDFNYDGIINTLDLLIFLGLFGSSCG